MIHLGHLALSGAGCCSSRRPRSRPEGRITPRRPRPVLRRERSRAGAACSRAIRAPFADPGRDPARPCRPQGVERSAVGRRRADPPDARRLADRGAVGAAARARRGAAAGARRRRPAARARRLRRRRAARRRARPRCASSCTRRTATCCTSSCRRCQPAQRRSTAARSRTACAFRSRCSRPCAPRCRPTMPVGVRISATDWVDGGWDIEQSVALRAGAEGARLRLHPRVERRRLAAAEDPARARLPGAVRRSASRREAGMPTIARRA